MFRHEVLHSFLLFPFSFILLRSFVILNVDKEDNIDWKIIDNTFVYARGKL